MIQMKGHQGEFFGLNRSRAILQGKGILSGNGTVWREFNRGGALYVG